MPALQVRDFPEDLYEQLKECAVREHRSIAQQTVAFVEQGIRQYQGDYYWDGQTLHRPPQVLDFDTEEKRKARIEKRRALFAELDKLPRIEVPDDFPDTVELIHQMREERDQQIAEACGIPYVKDGATYGAAEEKAV